MGEAKRKREMQFKVGVTYVRATPKIDQYVGSIKPDDSEHVMRVAKISPKDGLSISASHALSSVRSALEDGGMVYFCCTDAHDEGIAPWNHRDSRDCVLRVFAFLLKEVGQERLMHVLSKHTAELALKCATTQH